MTDPSDAARIGRVALTVRDLAAVTGFYRDTLGLAVLSADGSTATLGAADQPLLELRRDPAAVARPDEAGLFHTAFLLPQRSDLGDWLAHAAGQGIRLDGASDHLVSEALYLHDPEGNGIEVYVDRPRAEWITDGVGGVTMETLRLDLKALPLGAGWRGAPEGTRVGHVHLQVGDMDAADAFFRDTLRLTRTATRPRAGWYGWGGYHHHLAGNVWHSAGAGRRSPGSTGLAEVELLAPAGLLPAALTDPFGTAFRVTTTTP